MFSVPINSLNQRTPLHNSAKGGVECTVEYLLRKGGDVNIQDDDGVGICD